MAEPVADITAETASPSLESSRSSLENKIVPSDAFERLPDEIIEQILRTTDPDGFASLVLLNRKWRNIAQQSHLYHNQIRQCPTFAASHATLPEAVEENITVLRRIFAQQVKRNLFQAYLRPSETIIKLISTSISSSSCPGGEGMQFSASPRGHHLLAYNSSRIYLIDVRGGSYEMKREFKIFRRPVSACIKDDATLLAVLSTDTQVDVYDLESTPPRRKQSVMLDNPPRTIALSPCGSVLAAAYDGGIEVSSLVTGAMPTDKRAVKCDSVDALAFSFDGTQILGTTVHSASPNTVILTAPYFDPGSQVADNNISAMWTTSILFPNSSRDCSHATLLQDGTHEEAAWTFTYDRSFETFRAVRVEDLRNGTTYFTGPIPKKDMQSKLLPSTLPAATFRGDVVASGFQGKEIWLYGVPEHLDAVPEAPPTADVAPGAPGTGRRNSTHSNLSRHTSTRTQQDGGNTAVPKWQVLCDKLRNSFVGGSKIMELDGVSTVKWVAGFGGDSLKERLVVGGRGVAGPRLLTEDESIDFVDGGRVALLDFDYSPSNGTRKEITIEVGSDDAEVLQEERRSLATEVAIVRRRTVARQGGGRTAMLRAATTSASNSLDVPPLPQSSDTATGDDDDPLLPRRVGQHPVNSMPSDENDVDNEDPASIEVQEAFDQPYAHASPRSGSTLRRAATAAAVNRRLNPRLADGRPIEYRRADGRAEHPHESDADNWVPPPPPYQKDDPGSIPAFLRGPANVPLLHSMQTPQSGPAPRRVASVEKNPHPNVPRGVRYDERRHSPEPNPYHIQRPRTASDSTGMSRPQTAEVVDAARRRSTPYVPAVMDDLYDVSPPSSPPPATAARRPSEEGEESSATDGASGVVDLAASTSTIRSGHGRPDNLAHGTSSDVNGPGNEHDTQVPSLGLQIPQQGADRRSLRLQPDSFVHLPNANTWPRAQQEIPDTVEVDEDVPSSAPATKRSIDDTLPPLPSSNQLMSLSKRAGQGNPRRLSGGLPFDRMRLQSQFDQRRHTPIERTEEPQEITPQSATSSSSSQSEPDQPLIIATPSGISGAHDPPNQQNLGQRATNTPILAPVPRHPRAHQILPDSRPPVNRLETIYSITSQPEGNPMPPIGGQTAPPPERSNGSMLPAWLSRTNNQPKRQQPSGVHRQGSRAERSAARNIQDAKKKGWKGKGKSRNNGGSGGGGGGRISLARGQSSGQEWNNEPARSSGQKDKKCVVM